MTEETVDDRPTITLDGEKYIIEDLSDKGQYYTTQIQILNRDINDAQYSLERLNVSRAGFINMLRTDIVELQATEKAIDELGEDEEEYRGG
jgi:hypothetical protein